MLVVNAALADLQRRTHHQNLASSIVRRLTENAAPILPFDNTQLHVELLPQGPELSPQLQLLARDQQWLVSRRRLLEPIDGFAWLELRQNVTSSLLQERFSQVLLIAAAGVSILLTALLLRPVLFRGLVIPLDALIAQLHALEADRLGKDLIDAERQPQELQPIAVAFNQLQQRLALAWQREKAFIDAAAHELRTPITVISGHAQRLKRDELSPKSARSVALIASEAKRMAGIVSALRDLSRLDSEQLVLQLEPLDADEQLLAAYERCSSSAAGRLRLPLPAAQPLLIIQASNQRLQQCLDALIANALLYSEGPVQLRADLINDQVILHVLDSGPGIAFSEREHVLKRFTRGSAAVDTQGTGLGLALVDQLVRAMGGDVRIAEAPGGGADLQLRFNRLTPPLEP